MMMTLKRSMGLVLAMCGITFGSGLTPMASAAEETGADAAAVAAATDREAELIKVIVMFNYAFDLEEKVQLGYFNREQTALILRELNELPLGAQVRLNKGDSLQTAADKIMLTLNVNYLTGLYIAMTLGFK